jgi:outer membrane lipoprotein carrier protein
LNAVSLRRRAVLVGTVCAVVVLGLRPALAADDSVTRVDAYLSKVKTLTAGFVQVVRNRDGQITSRATGTLTLQRPDRFRWDYQQPYQQVIVADGKRLWLYDADLDQVTVRPLASGLGSTPAMLLSGAAAVSGSFSSGPVERDGDWTWYRLVPKDRGSDFETVSLGFDAKGRLVAMQLADKLGQRTELVFSDLELNRAVDAARFEFKPPKGADVIGDPG